MTRLILMRHAKSDWTGALPDHDRPLNPRGAKSAAALGDWLRDNGYIPGQILSSTAKRTQETVEGLGLETAPIYTRSLYLAPPETLLQAARTAIEDTVLIVAHNPGIGDLATQLVQSPPAHDRFFDYPTGATLVVDFPGTWDQIDLRQGQVVDFITPRELV